MFEKDKGKRLTEMVSRPGCACKIGLAMLSKLLSKLPSVSNPNILVGTDSSDDAGVYK